MIHDWSAYDALQVWIYSAIDNDATIQIVFDSGLLSAIVEYNSLQKKNTRLVVVSGLVVFFLNTFADNAADTGGWDYYIQEVRFDFTGWRLFTFAFSGSSFESISSSSSS